MKHYRSFILPLLIINLYLSSFFSLSFGQRELPSIDLEKVKPTQLPYRLECRLISIKENEIFYPVDLNNDGEDEIIIRKTGEEKPNVISIKHIEGSSIKYQQPFNGILAAEPNFIDINGDSKNEIVFSEILNNKAYIHIRNSEGDSILTFLAAINPTPEDRVWRFELKDCVMMDINDDDWEDLLLVIHTGYGYQPRGVIAFDLNNKTKIWTYKCGFGPQTPHLFDVDNDGIKEILLGSSAAFNSKGREVNETDDEHTYLTIVDSQTGENFKKPQKIGQKYGEAKIFLHDLNGDNEGEIIIHFRADNFPKEKSILALWTPINGHLSYLVEKEKNLSANMAFLDANKNGKDDFLIGWDDGTIEFWDFVGELISYREFTDFFPERFEISDLNDDGDYEIIVSGIFKGFKRIIILNRKLQLLAYSDPNIQTDEPKCIVNPGLGNEKFVLADMDSKTILLKMRKQSWIFPFLYWRWMGYGIILGILLSWIATFVKRRHRWKDKIKMNSLINSLQEGLIILDNQGCIVAINQMLEEIFKVNRESIIGLSYKTVFSDSIFNDFLQVIDESFQHKFIPLEKEITIFQKDKACNLLVSIGSFPMKKNEEPGKLITLRNITEIVQSKRAIAWAGLAQKLAHEIKTPLTTVMLTAQRLQMHNEANSGVAPQKTEKYLNNIIDQVHRLRKMTDALMKFARLEEPKFEPVIINDVIIECLIENRVKMGSGIRVEKNLMKDSSTIKADRHQLLVSFQNIIDNSIAAMEGKGVLTINTTLVQSLQGDSAVISEHAIQIEISDTGKGISSPHLNQLFQPFFSKFSEGTGLGLVIVKKIIDDHQGKIQIESQEGIGTTVFITLPV